MNMFRDLFTLALFALGLGLWVGEPEKWDWVAPAGPYAVNAVTFLADTRPWSFVICFVLALTLFMTRLKY